MIRFFAFFLIVTISLPAFAEKIVVIGDSLTCGPFGDALFTDLEAQRHQVTLYCAVSSAPSHWLEGKTPKGQRCEMRTPGSTKKVPCPPNGKVPTASSLLAGTPADRVIVALGTNSLYGSSAPRDYAELAKLAATGRRCTWVGPPQLKHDFQKNLNSFYDSLGTRVGSACDLVDSRDATAPGTPGFATTDGIHRTNAAGRAWYDALRSQLRAAKTKGPQQGVEGGH